MGSTTTTITRSDGSTYSQTRSSGGYTNTNLTPAPSSGSSSSGSSSSGSSNSGSSNSGSSGSSGSGSSGSGSPPPTLTNGSPNPFALTPNMSIATGGTGMAVGNTIIPIAPSTSSSGTTQYTQSAPTITTRPSGSGSSGSGSSGSSSSGSGSSGSGSSGSPNPFDITPNISIATGGTGMAVGNTIIPITTPTPTINIATADPFGFNKPAMSMSTGGVGNVYGEKINIQTSSSTPSRTNDIIDITRTKFDKINLLSTNMPTEVPISLTPSQKYRNDKDVSIITKGDKSGFEYWKDGKYLGKESLTGIDITEKTLIGKGGENFFYSKQNLKMEKQLNDVNENNRQYNQEIINARSPTTLAPLYDIDGNIITQTRDMYNPAPKENFILDTKKETIGIPGLLPNYVLEFAKTGDGLVTPIVEKKYYGPEGRFNNPFFSKEGQKERFENLTGSTLSVVNNLVSWIPGSKAESTQFTALGPKNTFVKDTLEFVAEKPAIGALILTPGIGNLAGGTVYGAGAGGIVNSAIGWMGGATVATETYRGASREGITGGEKLYSTDFTTQDDLISRQILTSGMGNVRFLPNMPWDKTPSTDKWAPIEAIKSGINIGFTSKDRLQGGVNDLADYYKSQGFSDTQADFKIAKALQSLKTDARAEFVDLAIAGVGSNIVGSKGVGLAEKYIAPKIGGLSPKVGQVISKIPIVGKTVSTPFTALAKPETAKWVATRFIGMAPAGAGEGVYFTGSMMGNRYNQDLTKKDYILGAGIGAISAPVAQLWLESGFTKTMTGGVIKPEIKYAGKNVNLKGKTIDIPTAKESFLLASDAMEAVSDSFTTLKTAGPKVRVMTNTFTSTLADNLGITKGSEGGYGYTSSTGNQYNFAPKGSTAFTNIVSDTTSKGSSTKTNFNVVPYNKAQTFSPSTFSKTYTNVGKPKSSPFSGISTNINTKPSTLPNTFINTKPQVFTKVNPIINTNVNPNVNPNVNTNININPNTNPDVITVDKFFPPPLLPFGRTSGSDPWGFNKGTRERTYTNVLKDIGKRQTQKNTLNKKTLNKFL